MSALTARGGKGERKGGGFVTERGSPSRIKKRREKRHSADTGMGGNLCLIPLVH